MDKNIKANHNLQFKKDLTNRLHRIEGQIKGIEKMINDDVYCDEVLIQISAVQSALSSVSVKLLDAHIRTCVSNQIIEGNSDDAIDSLMKSLDKIIKKGS
jgi:DNA-binding FrmR family transcriptional regulator